MPSIHMLTGSWVRLRMAFAGHGDNHAISMSAPDDCEMAVLAKDGVYLGEVPRMEPTLFFTPASRRVGTSDFKTSKALVAGILPYLIVRLSSSCC